MEPIYRKELILDEALTDCFGRLKGSALLYLVQEMAGTHVRRMALSPAPEELGLIWVITRHRVQIRRWPRLGETVRLETWPLPTTRVAYPRSVVAYDRDGNELFRSISLWVLVDRTSRALVLPKKSGICIRGVLLGNELPSPRGLSQGVCAAASRRTVRFTDLDGNGHMNNCRYLEWVADLLPASFHRAHTLTDMTLCYPTEAREGDELEISRVFTDDGVLHTDISRTEADKKVRVFSAELHYDEPCSVN